MLATSGRSATVVGVVGKGLDVKAGREAAYTAALNVLALTKKQLGSLNRMSRVGYLSFSFAGLPSGSLISRIQMLRKRTGSPWYISTSGCLSGCFVYTFGLS